MVLNTKFPVPLFRDYVQSLRNIRNIREEWSAKSPLEKWCYIYGIGKISGRMTGLPPFEEEMRVTWYSYAGYAIFATYTALALYTNVYYWLHGDFLRGLPCTCVLIGPWMGNFPFAVLALSKLGRHLHSSIDFGRRYLISQQHDDKKYFEICSKQMDTCIRNYIFRLAMIFVTLFVGLGKMQYTTIFMGIRITTIEAKIPFTKEKSIEEYMGNFLFQIIMFTWGGFAYFLMESGMELCMLVIAIAPKLIEFEIQKAEEKFESKKLNQLQIHYTFRNIVMQVMDIDEYSIGIVSYNYWRSLIAPIVFTYSIAISIFCQYMLKYPIGYNMALISYVQLFFMCGIAENISDDGIGEVLYDTKWYTLSIEQQKIVMHLINRKQNGTALTMGPFAQLNMGTVSIITKKIYSFMMFLLNCFD